MNVEHQDETPVRAGHATLHAHLKWVADILLWIDFHYWWEDGHHWNSFFDWFCSSHFSQYSKHPSFNQKEGYQRCSRFLYQRSQRTAPSDETASDDIVYLLPRWRRTIEWVNEWTVEETALSFISSLERLRRTFEFLREIMELQSDDTDDHLLGDSSTETSDDCPMAVKIGVDATSKSTFTRKIPLSRMHVSSDHFSSICFQNGNLHTSSSMGACWKRGAFSLSLSLSL